MIIFIVLTLAMFILMGKTTIKVHDEYYNRDVDKTVWKLNKKQFLAVIPLLLAVIFSMFVIIPANHVGIKYSPISGVKTETLTAGFKTKAPLDKITKFDTTVQEITLANIVGQTKDGQFVTIEATVKYMVNSTDAYKVFTQFKNLKNVEAQLLPDATRRSVDEITTQYNVFEIMGEQRNSIVKGIEQSLATRLSNAGISLYSVTINDADAGEDIEAAIKAEAIARQNVQKAEQELAKAEIDAQQKVVQAQADLEKAKILAEQKVVEAQAEAQANKLISESITQGLIDKIEAEARLKHGWVEITGANSIVVKE